MGESCSLCSPELTPIIGESVYWRLVLNHNQRFLGACFWVLRRHLESVVQLSSEEWLDLHQQIGRATGALVARFQPDHFNYAFLQNQDRHVHLHIYPRYAHPQTFVGVVFDDPDYPSHYTVPGPARHLSGDQYAHIVQTLQSAL